MFFKYLRYMFIYVKTKITIVYTIFIIILFSQFKIIFDFFERNSTFKIIVLFLSS